MLLHFGVPAESLPCRKVIRIGWIISMQELALFHEGLVDFIFWWNTKNSSCESGILLILYSEIGMRYSTIVSRCLHLKFPEDELHDIDKSISDLPISWEPINNRLRARRTELKRKSFFRTKRTLLVNLISIFSMFQRGFRAWNGEQQLMRKASRLHVQRKKKSSHTWRSSE